MKRSRITNSLEVTLHHFLSSIIHEITIFSPVFGKQSAKIAH